MTSQAITLANLLSRAIGYEYLFDNHVGSQPSFPPYDLIKTDDTYMLSIAVAGYNEKDLDITVERESLTITGNAPKLEEGTTLLHKGIARRAFTLRFMLGLHVIVEDAVLENGMLNIKLRKVVPDELKPRQLTIKKGD